MPPDTQDTDMNPVSHNLKNILLDISQRNVLPVVGPPETKGKRASVAVVIRSNPRPDHDPTTATNSPRAMDESFQIVKNDNVNPDDDLQTFLNRDWIRYADAECLLIKRASVKGDRWSGHIALPGGKRDAEDESDKAAAVRECWEEVGLNVDEEDAFFCGQLPERLIIADWGKKPLMVMCPHVFILKSTSPPLLNLQTSEVAAAYWVPFQTLINPDYRVLGFVDYSQRMNTTNTRIEQIFWKIMLGSMSFPAVKLQPTLAVYSKSETSLSSTTTDPPTDIITSLKNSLGLGRKASISDPSQQQQLLWGLTYGVLIDILQLLPPHDTLTSFTYPAFNRWDFQLWAWLYSKPYRQHNNMTIQQGWWDKPESEVVVAAATTITTTTNTSTLHPDFATQGRDKSNAIMYFLRDYHTYVKRAVWTTIGVRALVFAGLCWWNYKTGFLVSVRRTRELIRGRGLVNGKVFVFLGGLFKIGWWQRR